jgi:DNA-binding CsgD family transcriptional regulator/PAS domain-containing protein
LSGWCAPGWKLAPLSPHNNRVNRRKPTLIDHIYEAAIRPEAWAAVVSAFSEIFGGAPTMLGFLQSDDVAVPPRHSTGFSAALLPRFPAHLQKDLDWSPRHVRRCAGRFVDLASLFDRLDLEATALYREWMEPQHLAPMWPLMHTVTNKAGHPIVLLTVFRRRDQGAFSEDECAEADAYLSHLRRALDVHANLHGARRVRLALAEVMDRLPVGVLLLDKRRQLVLQNRVAERLIALEDGLSLDRGGPSAEHAREHAALQILIADAMEADEARVFDARGFLSISRPSGKRPYSVMVTPLRTSAVGEPETQARVAVFVSDPEIDRIAGTKALAELYGLTQAEVELLQLLSTGISLEEAASVRAISMNTARSHIKHMFAKTGVSRQGELVRMMLIGVGSLRGE